jgi:2-amino-4-hydroxy-6-hydroxymethyldihydropteridine diphosphokinase|tara:strand:+ start:583 stop:1113 length:531 start_codon:yes stop_codon:yes gene_type:complete
MLKQNHRVLLGIGSNLSSSYGDRFKNINIAMSYLEKYEMQILKSSSYYETPSYPEKKNPKFINVVIEITTYLKIEELASVLIFIEEMLQRKRQKKNDPRTCDIDIIDYDNQCLNFTYNKMKYIVPHEKYSIRNFVLFPLKEILPDWVDPKTNVHIDSLIKKLSIDDKKAILKIKKS